MMKLRESRCSKGFTLIELLVVLSVIALMVAVLLPALATAREQARKTLCMTNVRQLGIGIHVYATDFSELLVPSKRGNSGNGAVPTWRQLILPYMTTTDVYRCPSNPASDANINASETAMGGLTNTGYKANGVHYRSGSHGSTRRDWGMAPMDPRGIQIPMPTVPAAPNYVWRFNRLSDFRRTGTLILLAEGGYDAGPDVHNNFTPPWSAEFRFEWAHKGGTWSLLFLDGHARHMPLTETIRPGENFWAVENRGDASTGWITYLSTVEMMFR